MAAATKPEQEESTKPGDQDAPVAPVKEERKGPRGQHILRFTDLPEDVLSVVILGFEGTGKSLFAIKGAPLPLLLANLDRPLTKVHLGAVKRDRAEQIFIANMREQMDELNVQEALQIKDQLEDLINQNLNWLKGGTFMLDGGTLWRDVLKLSDPTIGTAIAAGKKFNPKDKASINTYVAQFISYLQDKGINFVITSHAAFSWEMVTTMNDNGEAKKQLARTKTVYPKLDDIVMERANVVLLAFKRCICGKNITTQDGTCTAVADAMDANKEADHQGRRHMMRIVTNKFNTSTEGTVWEDLDWATMRILCFEPAKAKVLLERD